MSVVIFKWNPGISSYRMLNHTDRIVQMNNLDLLDKENVEKLKMNWNAWDHDKIKRGDKCFLLKVGYGTNGIVDAGVIIKKAQIGDDWSDANRTNIYYPEFKSSIILNPDTCPVLSSDELSKKIPDFDWYKGHSGVVLTEIQAEKFMELWEKYLDKNAQCLIEKAEGHRDDFCYWDEKQRKAFKKKVEKSIFDECENSGRISYCQIRIDNSSRTYFYIDKSAKLKSDDYVKVPFGRCNNLVDGIVDSAFRYKMGEVPYPLIETKFVAKKIKNPSAELIKSLRQPRGNEVFKWNEFKKSVENLYFDEPANLIFIIDKKEYYFIIKKFSKKFSVVFSDGNGNTDIEIYNSVEELLSAKLFGRYKLKEIWDNLKFYFFDED